MEVGRSKRFKKQYQRLPSQVQKQFDAKLKQFIKTPTDPSLRNHPLKGGLAGYWSFSVNWDVRVIYRKKSSKFIVLAQIGTHNQLYGE